MSRPIDFKTIVLDHCFRYPGMQVDDLYKLTHQAAMGSEHAISDIRSARKWLYKELEDLPLTSVEPLVDVISPKRSIARIHLKPFIQSGGDVENLLQAFMRTANDFNGSTNSLIAYWKDIQALARLNEIPFRFENLMTFIDRMEAANFTAVHHSEEFVNAFDPHYRVIAAKFLDSTAMFPGKIHDIYL